MHASESTFFSFFVHVSFVLPIFLFLSRLSFLCVHAYTVHDFVFDQDNLNDRSSEKHIHDFVYCEDNLKDHSIQMLNKCIDIKRTDSFCTLKHLNPLGRIYSRVLKGGSKNVPNLQFKNISVVFILDVEQSTSGLDLYSVSCLGCQGKLVDGRLTIISLRHFIEGAVGVWGTKTFLQGLSGPCTPKAKALSIFCFRRRLESTRTAGFYHSCLHCS